MKTATLTACALYLSLMLTYSLYSTKVNPPRPGKSSIRLKIERSLYEAYSSTVRFTTKTVENVTESLKNANDHAKEKENE